jgi:hypothetical protein
MAKTPTPAAETVSTVTVGKFTLTLASRFPPLRASRPPSPTTPNGWKRCPSARPIWNPSPCPTA